MFKNNPKIVKLFKESVRKVLENNTKKTQRWLSKIVQNLETLLITHKWTEKFLKITLRKPYNFLSLYLPSTYIFFFPLRFISAFADLQRTRVSHFQWLASSVGEEGREKHTSSVCRQLKS